MIRVAGVLLVALTLAFSALAGDDDNVTRLRVEVKNLDNKPVDRASVIVKFVKGRSYVKMGKKVHSTWEMKTNQEGVAKMPPLPQGEILVQVIAKGYQTFGKTFTVEEPEKTLSVQLNPPQQQYSAHE